MKKTILSICAVVLATLAQAQIPTDSLLCYYPFHENFTDYANANHGTNNGATFANDRFGNPNKALFLDSTDFVSFGDIDLTQPNFTISFWFNRDSISLPQYILSKRTICNASNFMDIQTNQNEVGMELYSGTNNSGNAAPGGTFNINTWHHVVFIADQINQKTDKYVDGVLVSSKQWLTPMGSIDNPSPLVIGKSVCTGGNGSDYYNGYVDDIRVYKRTLDSNEVLALFNEPNPVIDTTVSISGHTITSNAIEPGTTYQWIDCDADSLINGATNQSYTVSSSGTYAVIIDNGISVDTSICTFITYIDTTVSISGTTITSNAIELGTTYQWIDCDNNSFIIGATDQSYTTNTSGNYAVIITNGTATDTSVCTSIVINSISSKETNHISIYPNPTDGLLQINSNEKINTIKLINALGKTILEFNDKIINIAEFETGIYFIEITTLSKKSIHKIIKE